MEIRILKNLHLGGVGKDGGWYYEKYQVRIH